jgi:hypothetical protein
MRTRYLFAVVILCLMAIPSVGQIRHVKGIKSIDAMYGITGYGSAYQLGYVKYMSDRLYLKFNGFYESGEDAGITYTSYGLDIMPAYTLWNPNESLYFNITGGLTFSMDKLTKGAELFSVDDTFKYGGFLGLETEIFLSDKFVLLLGGNQKFLLQTNFGSARYFINGGIRYNL